VCGIAGEVGRTPDDDALRAMVDSMRRRGPDGEGYVVEDRAALGMCRLAIIDVAGGEQPIATADGRWQIVYNGECYGTPALRRELEARGHRFRTRTDTEVVLHAVVEWGVAGLDRLNGMFAFAIWDRRDRELLLVRDRLGVKPLFYWAAPDRLVFSSTMTAIAGRPDFRGTIDPEAVELYLAHKFVTAPHTMYREIRKLPAGHVLRWRDGRADVQRWWDVPIGAPRRIGLDEAAEEVDARLADAARIRLVSERPVGLCLSGGVDSGLLAHALRDQRTETFSLGFADADYDEAPVAARVARALELPHHVLRAELDAARFMEVCCLVLDGP
jgi:asparagine synthase (glutamine-hydrolysing)